ncbi:MAG TPA: hypothetical protein VGL93_34760 [Streptosporangiaceae bacterium]
MRTRAAAAVAITGVVALAAAGCGSGNPPTSPGNAPKADAATPTTAPSKPPAFAKMRFSAETYACKPKATSQVKGAWETKAPRFAVKPGAAVTLGLSNSSGGKTPVIAVVYTRSGAHAYAHAKHKGDWSNVVFPKDFVAAKSKKKIKTYHKGIFTVVWVTTQGHKFISCDGFATVGAKEPKPRTSKHASPTPSKSKKTSGARKG